ncbi:MAG TPA: ammonium transporter [Verrucomicrobiota bacterium]|nr:ammonium transporter [Verrucomicrobiota bacterium]HRZ34780.1 ammonium transporter [Candidatus Paceibacterota bacterium]HRZ54441.1 ammonium transporter [Candidatus Paceibacterota bacterium]
MKRLLLLAAFLVCLVPSVRSLLAAESAAPVAPTLEQRIASLEAYVNNGDPTAALKDQDGKVPAGLATPTSGKPGPGHNGWMMVCAALVLFMTLPGLALFYGGLVRRKNVLSVLAQCLGIAGLVTILWWLCGYSLVFADGTGPIVGNLKFAFLKGVDSAPNTNYSYWVSHNVFSMYQMMFAIITPALIIGAIAERMRFAAVLVFVGLWMLLVYFPLAHMVWGANGLMNGVWNADAKIKAIDFAGGTVVHMSSGWSALILCIILGKRLGFPKEPMPPHSMVLCMVGTGMLWVGWYGFNAGSAVAADGVAANAFATTTIAAAVASFVWAMIEYAFKGKPSVLGFCSGIVAGLVVITPAAGFVTTGGAVLIGVLAGIIPFLAVAYLKSKLGYDDALDTFGVHAVGGTLGALLTGLLATPRVNANLEINLADIVGKTLWWHQVQAILLTIVLAVVMTTLIASIVQAVMGLRPSEETETLGLDLAEHGEEGYHGA